MAKPLTRLCIVRHGETPWNAERRLQGHLDIDLNENGVAQAQATGRALSGLHFSATYSSDLQRARRTAAACIRPGTEGTVSTHSGLRERHYGHFQGLTYDEAQSRFPDDYARFLSRDASFAFSEGGESLTAFASRIANALLEIVERHPGEQILIVTHGGVLDIIHRLSTGKSLDSPRDFTIPNAALNWITHDDGQWQLISWGDQSHLGSALDELSNA
ncbi:MAG: histidine phosphatase family protein [Betaproteobacteria bacterium HGW-Betaproteobacteria-13]|jgi:probable phosphoglycerate mutase|nr:MAG: histidine phosphatase family protein [Betaproteobacteria bacterium HGW-Betaproteobacteria-13]